MTLGFLSRNLAFAPRQTQTVAYKTLVRPQLEYASPVWHPHVKPQIQQVERSGGRLHDGLFGEGGIKVA